MDDHCADVEEGQEESIKDEARQTSRQNGWYFSHSGSEMAKLK